MSAVTLPKPSSNSNNKPPSDNLLISNVENRPTPSHIIYYRDLLDDEGKLKAGAVLEQSYLQKSNLMSEEDFIEANGGREHVYDGFKSAYTDDELKIMLENYRREPATRRATDIVSEFAIGERTELAMDTPKAYASQKRQDDAIRGLNQDVELVEYLDELATIDEAVNATDRFTEMLTSGETFGRSVLVIQRDEYGIPVRLIPLASIRLGKVYAEMETWELLGIEYKDYKGEQRILKAEDIIHYEASDYHITPNTRYFGSSSQEPVMYTAQSLRTAYEIAVPEIRKAKWAPFHILQFPQIQSQEKLDAISKLIQPGKSQIWGEGQIVVHKVDLNDVRMKEFHESLEYSQKEIFRNFGVALVFVFQDEQNRATAAFSSNLMRATKLTKIRTRLKNVLEPQWYNANLRALIKKRQQEKGLQGLKREPLAEYEQIGLVNALERSNKILQVDPDALPFRPRLKFVDKKIETFLELSEAALGWWQAGVLTKPEAAEVGGLDQYVERIAAREAQEIQAKEQQSLLAQPTQTPLAQDQQKITDLTPNLGSPLGGSSLKAIEGIDELDAQTKIEAAENERRKRETENLRMQIGLQIQKALKELQDGR